MKPKWVCNYAVLRFLPYPETQEFVNLGVVLACPAMSFFDFRLETKRRDRVTGFFPELDDQLFTQGRLEFRKELGRLRRFAHGQWKADQLQLDHGQKDLGAFFAEIVRPRESLFRFGSPGTVMTADPAVEIDRLFRHFVDRQFAQREDYQEVVMARRLADTFKTRAVNGYQQERLGDELYHVTLPFVRHIGAAQTDVRAIKPLDLAKREPTRIIEHGDHWLARIRRLDEMHYDPRGFLFPVHMPTGRQKIAAAERILEGLSVLKVKTVLFSETDQIVHFAAA